MTGLKARAIQGVTGAALALLTASCSSAGSGNTNYSQYYQLLRQSLSASFGNARVTREQAGAIPYASMGVRLDGGNQGLLILGTDSGGEQLWTSAAHVVIVTRDGRIVRTLGLDHDLSGTTTRAANLPAPAAALQAPFASTQLKDFPELNAYGLAVSCRTRVMGRQAIKILGQSLSTTRVDETCNSRNPDWSFTNSYWVDRDNGMVWRSRQQVHPKGAMVETEIFRPPG